MTPKLSSDVAALTARDLRDVIGRPTLAELRRRGPRNLRRGLLRWFGCRGHRRVDRGELGMARHEAAQVLKKEEDRRAAAASVLPPRLASALFRSRRRLPLRARRVARGVREVWSAPLTAVATGSRPIPMIELRELRRAGRRRWQGRATSPFPPSRRRLRSSRPQVLREPSPHTQMA